MKGQSSAGVETGQCCVRQDKSLLQIMLVARGGLKKIGPILVEDGHLTNRDELKVEAFSVGFAGVCFLGFFLFVCLFFSSSVINSSDISWAAWSPEPEDLECGSSDFPFVDAEITRDQLYQLNVHKSMGPDGIYPVVLKELMGVTAGPLLIIYERSWESGEVPADWKLGSVIQIYKKGVRKDPESKLCLCPKCLMLTFSLALSVSSNV